LGGKISNNIMKIYQSPTIGIAMTIIIHVVARSKATWQSLPENYTPDSIRANKNKFDKVMKIILKG